MFHVKHFSSPFCNIRLLSFFLRASFKFFNFIDIDHLYNFLKLLQLLLYFRFKIRKFGIYLFNA